MHTFFVRPLMTNTVGTMTAMKLISNQLTWFTPTSKLSRDRACVREIIGDMAEGLWSILRLCPSSPLQFPSHLGMVPHLVICLTRPPTRA